MTSENVLYDSLLSKIAARDVAFLPWNGQPEQP